MCRMKLSASQAVEVLRAAGEPSRLRILALLAREELAVLVRDAERLSAVWAERAADAGEYFARNAARWDEIRSLYVSDADVEDAILKAAGPGPFRRMVDLGSGTG